MTNPESCPHCGSRNLVTITEDIPPPHHAKLVCGDCGKFLKWLPAPVADFRMPLGKYNGTTLREIDRVDPQHLEWIARTVDYSNPKVQGKVREYLNLTRQADEMP